ncbi:hypothetical protein ARHIZOSPH14_10830 [Agromyces rhizosphaerae]|uniref:CobQ/CobB/MinD/ParA nucleotide binding domain-containing protein n=1 Tax=Agromyces rhizosphaerae TaxID=88374 RepID=A0A9W6CVI8_9MICO|nr:AAA family ATPase [Agromyces rhizosphaerae]GLI26841.1 hypothetical protein ARHIZOSPH14_10830 [Agromyces rhizosphaerae]
MKPIVLVTRNTVYDLRMRRLLEGKLRSIPGEFLGIGTSLVVDRVGDAPKVALLGPELSESETLTLAAALVERHPRIGLVIVETERGDPETWIGRGVHAVIPAAATDAKTLDLLTRLQTWLAVYGGEQDPAEFGGIDRATDAPVAAAPEADAGARDQEVVWVAETAGQTREEAKRAAPAAAAQGRATATVLAPERPAPEKAEPDAPPRMAPPPPPPASWAAEPKPEPRPDPVADAAPTAPEQPAEPETPKVPSEVVVVAAPKGGQGKTTAAINLAVGLAEVAPGQVVLVDADLQFGDIASALDLPDSRTIVSALETRSEDDLVDQLVRHEDDFFVLPAPPSPEDAEHVGPADLVAIVRRLNRRFRYVVVDTTPGVGAHSLALIRAATDGVFIANINVPSLNAMRKELQLLADTEGMPPNRHMVLNFTDRRAGLTPAEAVEVVGTPFDVEVPRSVAVLFASNEGVPLIHHDVRDAAAKALRRLVQRIDPAAVPTRRRIHRRWRAS